jgi:integrase/recombinase XerC
MTVRDSFGRYLRTELSYSPHTVKAYHSDLGQLEAFLLNRYGVSLEALSTAMVRTWVVEMQGRQLQRVTIQRKLAAARLFFRWYAWEHPEDGSYASRASVPRIRAERAQPLPTHLSEKNVWHLLERDRFSPDWTGDRDQLMLSLMFGAGLRVSETTAFPHPPHYRSGLLSISGKGGRQRQVPLPTELETLLARYQEKRPDLPGPEHLLFTTQRAKPVYRMLVWRVARAFGEAVLGRSDLHPHAFRHTFATLLLEHGADINAIKELLGHTSLAATQRYTHLSGEALRKSYRQAHPRAQKP